MAGCISSIAWRCSGVGAAPAGGRAAARRETVAGRGAATAGVGAWRVRRWRRRQGDRARRAFGCRRTLLVGFQVAQVAVLGIGQTQLERAHQDQVAVGEALLRDADAVDQDAVLRPQIAHHDAVRTARERRVLAGELVDLEMQVARLGSSDEVTTIAFDQLDGADVRRPRDDRQRRGAGVGRPEEQIADEPAGDRRRPLGVRRRLPTDRRTPAARARGPPRCPPASGAARPGGAGRR